MKSFTDVEWFWLKGKQINIRGTLPLTPLNFINWLNSDLKQKMQYRRFKVDGGTYFFTIVTHQRRKFLCEPQNISLLRNSFRYVIQQHPFKIEAIVILPDHIHSIWTLPQGDNNFSTRWRLIKSYFSHQCASIYQGEISISRKKKKEQAVWQRRFWEHHIRDEKDFIHHVEYIHYNPVKHGLVLAPKDWEYSSFHRYVQKGLVTAT